MAPLAQGSGTQPDDLRFNEQWALSNTGQAGGQFGSDIGVTTAWQTTTGSHTTVIAVIDSGIDFTHPDLANNKWMNATSGTQGDLNGWDYVTDNGVIRDEQGHGTAIAGIIAAQGNNGLGTAGVMWQASLMSLRVLDSSGIGDVEDAVEAIDYAATHGAQVINISWGTVANRLALKDAIERATARLASLLSVPQAIMDKTLNKRLTTQHHSISEGWLPLPQQTTSISSRHGPIGHPRRVTVAAPGVDLLTTQMGGGYWLATGTSASAPLVTGVAGLIKTARPALNTHGVQKAITDGARQVASLTGKVSCGGVVSASGALAALPGNAGNDNGNGNPRFTPTPPPNPPRSGPGPGGSYSTTPPPTTTGAPGPNLPNLDQLRNSQPTEPKAKTFIQSNLLCADCGDGGGSGGGYYPSGDPRFATARTRLVNETGTEGVDLGSRNFNWSLPLVSLPGRAGLDLSFTLSYNSLVWTKDGSNIKFNADPGTPAPGF